MTPPLVLNEPLGSDIANGVLYLADRDGGTEPERPCRRPWSASFDMKTGDAGRSSPRRQIDGLQRHRGRRRRHDLRNADGRRRPEPDATTWQVWKITPDGAASIFVQGAPMRQPNGIAFDQKGNIVVVNIGTDDVHHIRQDGKLLKTEKAAQSGNDGLVMMKDGTKYVSSVVNGGVSRIRPGRAGGADRAEHPEPRVDVLRPRRESAGDSDERQQRAVVHSTAIANSNSQAPTPN